MRPGAPASPAAATLSVGGSPIVTNAANVTPSGADSVFVEINSLANITGSFAVANGRNFTTASALANSGTLTAAHGSTLTVTGALTQTATGTLTGNGTGRWSSCVSPPPGGRFAPERTGAG